MKKGCSLYDYSPDMGINEFVFIKEHINEGASEYTWVVCNSDGTNSQVRKGYYHLTKLEAIKAWQKKVAESIPDMMDEVSEMQRKMQEYNKLLKDMNKVLSLIEKMETQK